MHSTLSPSLQVEPRPYQQRIVRKALDMFDGTWVNRTGDVEPPAQSVMIESPTGSGKTVMGLSVARELQQRHGWKFGWVAMRRNLLTQAEEENRRRGFDVDMELISMFDKNPPAVDALVVDEAQHDAAMSMSNLHSILKPKKILGLTATPYRTDRVKLCFDKVITDAGIQSLIQDGYLSRYHHYTIPHYTPQSVADHFAREPERWGQSLIFFHRYEQCLECQRELARRGHDADIVTATSNRERQLDDFASGKRNVLLNMAILTEGFDCPSLKTVFCRPSGKSCTIQMAGRAFRKHPALPFKQIVQCEKTRHPMVKSATPAEQYLWLNDGWRTLKINQHLADISRQALKLIAQSRADLPDLVLQHRMTKPSWHRATES